MVFFLLVLLILRFQSFSTASQFGCNLTTLSNEEFWEIKYDSLVAFHMDLNQVLERLRGPHGVAFSRTLAYNRDNCIYRLPLCHAINNISMEQISEILFEHNPFIVKAILEDGMYVCFRSWHKLDFERIPNILIPRFPIEFIHPDAFSYINVDVLVDIIMSRSKNNLFKDFFLLFKKLPERFWKLSRILNCPVIRARCSAFHFRRITDEVEMERKLPSAIATAGTSVHLTILEVALNVNFLGYLHLKDPIDEPAVYTTIERYCELFNFVAQTFFHSLLSGERLLPRLLYLIIDRIKMIKSSLLNRMAAFPAETVYLNTILSNLNKCYSSQICLALTRYNLCAFPLIREYFGENDFIEYPSVGEMISSLFADGSRGFESIHPEFLIQMFIMSANEDSEDVGVPALVNYITSNFAKQPQSVIPVLAQSTQILFSFGNAIKCNRLLTHRLYAQFKNSTNLHPERIDLVRDLVSNDQFYVASVVAKGANMNHSKYAVVFAESFRDDRSRNSRSISSSVVSSTSSAFHRTYSDSSDSSSKFGSKMNYGFGTRNKRSYNSDNPSDSDSQPSRKSLKSYSLVSSDDDEEEFPVENVHQILVPDISMSFDTSTVTGEYVHIDYFLDRLKKMKRANELLRGSASKSNLLTEPEVHPEIRFLNAMLVAIRKALRNPHIQLSSRIDGLKVGGFGILKDTLINFGKLLSLPRFKTVQFSEELRGFVPMPLLCPKVMGYIGAWTALCLKLKVTLPWSFAEDYRKFLFYASDSDDTLEALSERMHGSLFEVIRTRFVMQDEAYVTVLPRMSRVHRLFELPNSEPPSPFVIESRFLEQVLDQGILPLQFKSTESIRDFNVYIALLKISLQRLLSDGRDEFQKCFTRFFKRNFVPFLTFHAMNEYVGDHKISADAVWSAIRFNGIGSSIFVVDDFEDSGSDHVTGPGEIRILDPLQLFKRIIFKLTLEQLEKFLIFVTGMPRIRIGTLNRHFISFFAVESSSSQTRYCRAHTCFNHLCLMIIRRSAKATYENLLESITMSSGFVLKEF